MSINYQGPFSFDLTFMRCKLTSPGLCIVSQSATVSESAQKGAAPAICTLRKRERAGPTENPSPPSLYMACNQKLIGMSTGTAPDCGPWPGGTSPALRWSVFTVKPRGRGGRSAMCLRVRTSDEKKSKWNSKCNFFTSCQKFRKIWKTFLQDQVILKNLIYENFVRCWTSKLVRSTLTSPGRIRVNCAFIE